jgi:PIN domain nuclease of toxin-antitoxin system
MIILDTHAWIWYVTESDKISINALNKIKDVDVCGVSAISCWEIAMLISKGRLKLNVSTKEWINKALNYNKIELIPLSPDISISSTELDKSFHNDPADRIITATALVFDCELITKDKKISNYSKVKTIW